MKQVLGRDVNTVNRNEVPSENETICDDMDVNLASEFFTSVKVYFRDKDECPFNRGNWIIDFFTCGDTMIPIFCMKLPKSMTEEQVKRWVKPLVDKLKNKVN